MSSTDRNILESIEKISGTQFRDKVHLFSCTVNSVNIGARTCQVNTLSSKDSITIDNVKLMASVDDGIFIVPSVGSTVYVIYNNHAIPYVALFSQIDSILFISGTNALSISGTGGIQFNDGSLGGMVEVASLVTKLNNLENYFNALNTKVNALAPTPVIPPLINTVRADVENTKITQG